ncbi:Thioredoxin-like protein slr1139 [Moraxella caprae]|uniref:Thioredoxin-like protein slr1139 n=1 Tax=Moraxella caprae TaxID=90240 RepID=A0A378R2L6_9GAMM|nr:redoxin domain-containing protein [Moraxella caprae]STZ08100.1 Thioredoxin-like protein slr1139 [Moraxella caprae]
MKKLRKTLFSALTYLVMFVVIYTAVNLWRSPVMPDSPKLVYQNSTGQVVDVVSQSYDTPVLIYFWGSWCSVCRMTSPNVQALHADGRDVLSVAVSSGDDNELLAYMNKHGYDFYTINDQHGAVFGEWGGQVTPSFVILDDGKVAQSFTGIAPLWLLKLRLWWVGLY